MSGIAPVTKTKFSQIVGSPSALGLDDFLVGVRGVGSAAKDFLFNAAQVLGFVGARVQRITVTEATTNIDFVAGRYVIVDLQADTAFSVSNWYNGIVNQLTLEIHNSGSFNVTFPPGWRSVGGLPLQTTANGVDMFTFTSADGGGTVYAYVVGNNLLPIV